MSFARARRTSQTDVTRAGTCAKRHSGHAAVDKAPRPPRYCGSRPVCSFGIESDPPKRHDDRPHQRGLPWWIFCNPGSSPGREAMTAWPVLAEVTLRVGLLRFPGDLSSDGDPRALPLRRRRALSFPTAHTARADNTGSDVAVCRVLARYAPPNAADRPPRFQAPLEKNKSVDRGYESGYCSLAFARASFFPLVFFGPLQSIVAAHLRFPQVHVS